MTGARANVVRRATPRDKIEERATTLEDDRDNLMKRVGILEAHPADQGGCCPGEWIVPELVNGWEDTTPGSSSDECSFAYRHGADFDVSWTIDMRGHIEGTSGTFAFVMPEADRPPCDKYGITEGEDSVTGDGIVVEWYIETATGYFFITFPISGGGGGGGGGGGAVLDYTEKTSNTTVSATTEATANTVVTAAALTFDGATAIDIEFFSPIVRSGTATNATIIALYEDGSSIIGLWAQIRTSVAGQTDCPVRCAFRKTPTAGSHIYSARAWCPAGDGTVFAGGGGSGNIGPAFIKITEG